MPTTGTRPRETSRRRSFGVAPYVPGRTTKEYIADGTLRAVEADDEVAALVAYAAAHGLTLTGEPTSAMGGKRTRATLSDGREVVARYLKAALAELLPTEPIVADPDAPRHQPDAEPADPDAAPAHDATPEPPASELAPSEPTPPPEPPEPPEFVPPGAVTTANLDRLRPTLQPRSWDIAAALWDTGGADPQSIQAVAERFAVTPAFVRMVAASVTRLAADDAPSMG